MDTAKLGIDFGGSGIKGALVDVSQGQFISERHRIPTPQPATPEAVTKVIQELVQHFEYKGPVGVAFPAAIQQGVVQTASNIDKSWIGVRASDLFSEATGCRVKVLNDADAAGMAEQRFGHGKDTNGVVIMITIGSGLGTSIFVNGTLLPNTELGHIHYKDKVAEKWAADAVRKREELSWKKWGKRFNKYLAYLEKLFYPDLFILGGGVSNKPEKFEGLFPDVNTPVKPAMLQNKAGIVGAAFHADL